MSARATIRVLSLAGALLVESGALALNPALDVSQYGHTAWKNSDLHVKGFIYSIAQTSDGYLWLGTEVGLYRFDGVRAVLWTLPAGTRLPTNDVHSLRVARDGSLWIGTAKGLARWKGGALTRYPELDGRAVVSILEDHSGTVWASGDGPTAARLCAIQTSGIRCYGDDSRFGPNILSIRDYQGGLWVGASTGLWRWKPDPPQRYPKPEAEINDLIAGNNGALWMALGNGLRQWAGGKIELAPLPFAGTINAHRLLRDREGSLWIGTAAQGLAHVHQGRTDTFGPVDGLSGNHVQDLFEDREGNVWAATVDGLDRFRDLAVPSFSVRQGLASPGAVVAARDGSLWFGSSDGVSRWSNGRMTVYRMPKGGAGRAAEFATQPAVREVSDSALPDNIIESLGEDDRGRIWVSTVRGVAYFENGRFMPAGSVSATMVHNITEAGSGNIWINEQRVGLLHLVEGRVVEKVSWMSLGREDIVSTLAFDRARGGLWLGLYQGGLVYFQDGGIRLSYGAGEGLGGGRVNDLRIDGDGTLWAATEGGLSRLKDGRIATLSSRNGLPCDTVQWAMEDDAGSVWLDLPCGLARVPHSELDAWAAGRRQTVNLAVFDSSDGLKSLPTAPGYSPRVAKSRDGKLWFTTATGVSVIDPGHLPFNKLPPPVAIEQITADRKPYDAGANLRLPPLVRDVEIDYTALSYVAPEKIQFRYKLEGRDGDWHDVGNRRQAFYDDLPPHRYRFRVMAANNSGVWNEAGASLDFSVDPSYYQTNWFRALVVAAILALLATFYHLRLLYLKRQFSIRMEERIGERMRLARDLHDTLLQSFQGVLLKFHAVTYRLGDRPEARKELEGAIDQARAAIAEGRDAVQGLRSSTVVMNDLARAITTFGEGLASDQNEFRVHVEGASRDLAPLVRDEVYRIAGEALRNAFRHADAKRIEVEIHYEARQLRLRVRDDGKGIDPQVLSAGGRSGHHGLPGMRERVDLVGGKVAVWSELNSGTEIELVIPSAIAYAAGGQGNLSKE